MIDLILLTIVAHLDKLVAISMLILLGISLRVTLQIFGQTWVQTKAHTTTILILPIITYVITKVIAGNIALSLGLVGALSIVRFRNPVRSPLELSVYFGAITMGIAASVSLIWLNFLVIAIAMAIATLIIVNKTCGVFFSTPFFIASFSEGNSLSTITIVTKDEIPYLDSHRLLQSKVLSVAEEKIIYQLSSNNFDLLRIIQKELQDEQKLVSIELRR